MQHARPKILVILGPNASGKSDLALRLAKLAQGKQFQRQYGVRGAEIISADSRQVYRGLDIGTGKVPLLHARQRRAFAKASTPPIPRMGGVPTYRNIPHHLIDVASPKRVFTVAQYQKLARRALQQILRRGKLPIICGGTGLYIDALLYNWNLPAVPPNPKLRQRFDKLTVEHLFKILQKLDPRRAANIDRHNKRRLVRALEIVLTTGKPIPPLTQTRHTNKLQFVGMSPGDILKIGIRLPNKILRDRIHKRLWARLRQGMIAEARRLHRQGLSWKRMEELGLEYRFLAKYLKKFPRMSASGLQASAMAAELEAAIWHYAKRQMTWFSARGGSALGGKRDKEIHWVQKPKEAITLTHQFLLK